MNKLFFAAGCSVFIAFAGVGYAHDSRPAGADEPAGEPRDKAAGDAGARRPDSGEAADQRPADRTASPRKDDERVDDRVESSDGGSTATESGVSKNGDAAKSGAPNDGGVVTPKEP
ncbi:hypothetical protein [Pusillimonas sp.]|uniref:hypothetical protein n=1 Tax=Pusillimonas sp. TaxID=3040095 RepID=UPI0029A440C4|nr:hypothetical protein [Pusillimonas sp.]MDX3894647.1 hypothetical protein [Pusillimonas sp.]